MILINPLSMPSHHMDFFDLHSLVVMSSLKSLHLKTVLFVRKRAFFLPIMPTTSMMVTLIQLNLALLPRVRMSSPSSRDVSSRTSCLVHLPSQNGQNCGKSSFINYKSLTHCTHLLDLALLLVDYLLTSFNIASDGRYDLWRYDTTRKDMILRLGYGIQYTKYTYLQSSHDLSIWDSF